MHAQKPGHFVCDTFILHPDCNNDMSAVKCLVKASQILEVTAHRELGHAKDPAPEPVRPPTAIEPL